MERKLCEGNIVIVYCREPCSCWASVVNLSYSAQLTVKLLKGRIQNKIF